MAKARSTPYDELEAFDSASGHLNAVIETPQRHRTKFKYDARLGLFRINKILPAGAVFPFDFGFIPSTLAQDGDPVDVLVLLDEPAFTGCVVPARLIGVIEAEEKEDGRVERNDRLIAVAESSVDHDGIDSLESISPNLLKEIEHFFSSYNEMEGKEFKPLGTFGPERARRLVEQGMKAYQKKNK